MYVLSFPRESFTVKPCRSTVYQTEEVFLFNFNYMPSQMFVDDEATVT